MTSTSDRLLTDESTESTTPTVTPTEKRPSYTAKAPAPLSIATPPPQLNERAAALIETETTLTAGELGIESPTEMRVQVDRRLLERLLLVADNTVEGAPTDAEVFFTKVRDLLTQLNDRVLEGDEVDQDHHFLAVAAQDWRKDKER